MSTESKATILCVDDRAENLRVRTMLLEQFGYDTIAVPDYESTLRVVSEREVDLLLIDYHLECDQNGEDIARAVRAMRPEIPLIILTGDPKIPESVHDAADAVLIKGASNPRTMLQTVETLIRAAWMRRRGLS